MALAQVLSAYGRNLAHILVFANLNILPYTPVPVLLAGASLVILRLRGPSPTPRLLVLATCAPWLILAAVMTSQPPPRPGAAPSTVAEAAPLLVVLFSLTLTALVTARARDQRLGVGLFAAANLWVTAFGGLYGSWVMSGAGPM